MEKWDFSEEEKRRYKEWMIENKSTCLHQFAKDCDLNKDEVEDWYGEEFDYYCKDWFNQMEG